MEKELHSWYRSPNIVRMIKSIRLRWAGHVARILTGNPTGKRPLWRPRRRWEDNTRMDLEEMGINAGNWVDSAQDRDYRSPCECGIEPPGSISHGVS